jgi:hypothetical protein
VVLDWNGDVVTGWQEDVLQPSSGESVEVLMTDVRGGLPFVWIGGTWTAGTGLGGVYPRDIDFFALPAPP